MNPAKCLTCSGAGHIPPACIPLFSKLTSLSYDKIPSQRLCDPVYTCFTRRTGEMGDIMPFRMDLSRGKRKIITLKMFFEDDGYASWPDGVHLLAGGGALTGRIGYTYWPDGVHFLAGWGTLLGRIGYTYWPDGVHLLAG
jgi:hypothetical protein